MQGVKSEPVANSGHIIVDREALSPSDEVDAVNDAREADEHPDRLGLRGLRMGRAETAATVSAHEQSLLKTGEHRTANLGSVSLPSDVAPEDEEDGDA